MVAFACTRFSWRFNIFFLILFTAGNLMPQQVIFQPLFQIYKRVPLPDLLSDTNTGSLLGTKIAVILIHIAFQTGFCTFVLSNYMKTIPKEIGEAAAVDGASVPRQFFQVILPLTRPALAALATLEFTWLYNDFFWGAVLLNQGSERPITSSIAVLNGQYASNYNLIAAASIMIALPTLIVYLILQKQFISGSRSAPTRDERERDPAPHPEASAGPGATEVVVDVGVGRAGDRCTGEPPCSATARSTATSLAPDRPPIVHGSGSTSRARVGGARARRRVPGRPGLAGRRRRARLGAALRSRPSPARAARPDGRGARPRSAPRSIGRRRSRTC
jgi:ABC-type spermidine/putrescine transport system permease subunit II